MNELGRFLRGLRGKESLRDVADRSGISHNYLSIVEKGVDPRSGSPVKPSPDTLKKISDAYNYPYRKLMLKAGYLDNEIAEEENTKKVTNDQAKNVAWNIYTRLPQDKKKLIDDMLRVLDQQE